MEELILRALGVSSWLLMAFTGYGLYVHDFKRWGKTCLAVALTALSLMALSPWGVNQALFDALAPPHGHAAETVMPAAIHSSDMDGRLGGVNETKIGEVYLKLAPEHRTKAVRPATFSTFD